MIDYTDITGPYVKSANQTVTGLHGFTEADLRSQWLLRSRREGWTAPWPRATVTYNIDADGWRRVEGSGGSPRVWFVGCSETFGQSVPTGETVADHYTALTGISSANLGWPGSSNAWNCQRLINRILVMGQPDHVFFSWTGAERFVTVLGDYWHHWHPNFDTSALPRSVAEHFTQEQATLARQWQVFSVLNSVLGSRVTHWTPFPVYHSGRGLPEGAVAEWGMPMVVPDDLAQDAGHSNGRRHLRFAEHAAEIWSA